MYTCAQVIGQQRVGRHSRVLQRSRAGNGPDDIGGYPTAAQQQRAARRPNFELPESSRPENRTTRQRNIFATTLNIED
jgi:hypothetical protein